MEANPPELIGELWHYLSTDGRGCPAVETCERRQSGGWCVLDYEAKIREAYDIALSAQAREDMEAFKKLVKDILPQPWEPCRPFELAQMLASWYCQKPLSLTHLSPHSLTHPGA